MQGNFTIPIKAVEVFSGDYHYRTPAIRKNHSGKKALKSLVWSLAELSQKNGVIILSMGLTMFMKSMIGSRRKTISCKINWSMKIH